MRLTNSLFITTFISWCMCGNLYNDIQRMFREDKSQAESNTICGKSSVPFRLEYYEGGTISDFHSSELNKIVDGNFFYLIGGKTVYPPNSYINLYPLENTDISMRFRIKASKNINIVLSKVTPTYKTDFLKISLPSSATGPICIKIIEDTSFRLNYLYGTQSAPLHPIKTISNLSANHLILGNTAPSYEEIDERSAVTYNYRIFLTTAFTKKDYTLSSQILTYTIQINVKKEVSTGGLYPNSLIAFLEYLFSTCQATCSRLFEKKIDLMERIIRSNAIRRKFCAMDCTSVCDEIKRDLPKCDVNIDACCNNKCSVQNNTIPSCIPRPSTTWQEQTISSFIRFSIISQIIFNEKKSICNDELFRNMINVCRKKNDIELLRLIVGVYFKYYCCKLKPSDQYGDVYNSFAFYDEDAFKYYLNNSSQEVRDLLSSLNEDDVVADIAIKEEKIAPVKKTNDKKEVKNIKNQTKKPATKTSKKEEDDGWSTVQIVATISGCVAVAIVIGVVVWRFV
ncbi:hypothetical protein TCON_0734 [Astathelohania contejeani]|uniref:Uncharacterized protein n=1 Tax=Astathelohania contejeani TaxID=164912 RepID=A0ABQ7I0X3_9MICR|nr:hypothetical protein TCON_0734 [Thelohania contejeani]